MLDQSKEDRLSSKTTKRRRETSSGPPILEGAKPGSKLSTNQTGASSNNKRLSKATPQSCPTTLTKDKRPTASTKGSVVDLDASTNSATIKKERIFGTDDEDSTRALAQQVFNVTPSNGKYDLPNLKWALATVHGIAPKDALEGLLAAQMIGVHNLAMESLMRAAREGATSEEIDANVNRAVRLLRTFTLQMEALNRHRGKPGQSMVVGNVNVKDGGQAIVGPVTHPGREKASTRYEGKNTQ
jgi:hypothetical protein